MSTEPLQRRHFISSEPHKLTLQYPVYFPLVAAFNSTSGNMSALAEMVSTVKANFEDPTLLGSFVEYVVSGIPTVC